MLTPRTKVPFDWQRVFLITNGPGGRELWCGVDHDDVMRFWVMPGILWLDDEAGDTGRVEPVLASPVIVDTQIRLCCPERRSLSGVKILAKVLEINEDYYKTMPDDLKWGTHALIRQGDTLRLSYNVDRGDGGCIIGDECGEMRIDSQSHIQRVWSGRSVDVNCRRYRCDRKLQNRIRVRGRNSRRIRYNGHPVLIKCRYQPAAWIEDYYLVEKVKICQDLPGMSTIVT